MTPEIKTIPPGLAKVDGEEKPEIKTIHPHLVKVDGEVEVEFDSVFAYQDGRVAFLLVPLPSREKTDMPSKGSRQGKVGYDKLVESDNPVFMDLVLKEGPCEVEVRFSTKSTKFPGRDEPRSVYKGRAERKRTNIAGGQVGGNLHSHVRLDSLDPPTLTRDEETKRLRVG